MMEQEDKFDDLIRLKFDENEFNFSEKNWEKAEKMLDAARRLRKIYLWTSVFIVGIFIGITLILLIDGKKKNENTKINTELSPEKVNKIEILSSVKSDEALPLSPIAPSKQEENPVSQVVKVKEDLAEEVKSLSNSTIHPKTEKEASPNTGIISNTFATENSNKAEKLIANRTANPNKTILKDETKTFEQPVSEPTKKVKKTGSAEKTIIQNNKSPLLAESAKSNKPNDTHQSAATKVPLVKTEPEINSPVNPSTPLETESKINKEEEPITKNIPEEKLNNDVQTTTKVIDKNGKTENNSFNSGIQKNEDKKVIIEDAVNIQTPTQKTELKVDSETNPVIPVETQKLVSDSAKLISDSSNVTQQNSLTPPPPIPGGLASATFFSIDAGTNLEIGWKYDDATEAGGFNPVLGLGITHYFNQKWSFNSGVQYGSIAYLKASKKSFSNVSYGFGSTTIDTIIDTRFLHYAVAPLLFQYSFNDKNTISFGGSLSYLLNSKSKVSIKTTTITAVTIDSSEVISSAKSETGYYADAFNKWDASLAFGYQRRISQRFSVSAIANFGLLDIKNNTFFSREIFERNVGMKITLTYNLFEF